MNKEKVLDYLKENVEVLRDLVIECNSWNGSLDWLDYQENDEEFFNIYFEGNPNEAVRATYYGEYKYMDEYVRFNAYGNLKSASRWEVEKELEESVEEIFDTWYELYQDKNVDTYDNNLKELLEEDEEDEGGEE